MGPRPEADVGLRHIPTEPMYILFVSPPSLSLLLGSSQFDTNTFPLLSPFPELGHLRELRLDRLRRIGGSMARQDAGRLHAYLPRPGSPRDWVRSGRPPDGRVHRSSCSPSVSCSPKTHDVNTSSPSPSTRVATLHPRLQRPEYHVRLRFPSSSSSQFLIPIPATAFFLSSAPGSR
jgi:hypothetical protein